MNLQAKQKVLIPNRGEIAVRIIRAAREMGLVSVLAHSCVDSDSLAAKMADQTIDIGPALARKSYLNAQAILEAAKQTKADLIHPGYGFLAENADFADAVTTAGIQFVGPSGDIIRKMGDKAKARESAIRAGVAVVPGSDGVIGDIDTALSVASSIGYPLMIKAVAGGGGRGIRIVRNEKELRQFAPQASAEAKAAFGNGDFYLERVIENARHIEVQVLGDGKHYTHCFERECSIQRRRQKIWEEAPCVALPMHIRHKLCDSAVALASSVAYSGAGTVEYLYDQASGEFYFMEMNTRIQVEHPVTEMITGVDLVSEMLAIALGERMSVTHNSLAVCGHAIEVRINAEDPVQDFLPCPGEVTKLQVPGGLGVRFDHMLYQGYSVVPFYDSLLGKLIVHANSRKQALGRLASAITELQIEGMQTTANLVKKLLDSPEIFTGDVHTNWLEQWLQQPLP